MIFLIAASSAALLPAPRTLETKRTASAGKAESAIRFAGLAALTLSQIEAFAHRFHRKGG
jgi:hypothetical protein